VGAISKVFRNLQVHKKNVFVLMYRESLNMLAVRGRNTATSGAICTNYFNSQDEKPKSTEVLQDSLQVIIIIIIPWLRKLFWHKCSY